MENRLNIIVTLIARDEILEQPGSHAIQDLYNNGRNTTTDHKDCSSY